LSLYTCDRLFSTHDHPHMSLFPLFDLECWNSAAVTAQRIMDTMNQPMANMV
jgi:hypothetical protein